MVKEDDDNVYFVDHENTAEMIRLIFMVTASGEKR